MITHIQIRNKDHSGCGTEVTTESVLEFYDAKNELTMAVTAKLAMSAPALLMAIEDAIAELDQFHWAEDDEDSLCLSSCEGCAALRILVSARATVA